MRYFKATFVSKKTIHPLGQFEKNGYVQALNKKLAVVEAINVLAELDPEHHQHYKLPRLDEISSEAFDSVNKCEDPDCDKKTLDLHCALIVMFGRQKTYDDDETLLAVDFLLDGESDPEYAEKFGMLRNRVFNDAALYGRILSRAELIDLIKFIHHIQDGYSKELVAQYVTEQLAINDSDDTEEQGSMALCNLDRIGKAITKHPKVGTLCTSDEDNKNNSTIQTAMGRFGRLLPKTYDIGMILERIELMRDVKCLGGDVGVRYAITGIWSASSTEVVTEEVEVDVINHAGVAFDEEVSSLNARLFEIEPGGYLVLDDLDNEIYHACDGYSKSKLDLVAKSPALLQWQKTCPVDRDKLKAFDMGTAVHAAILEPELYESNYVKMITTVTKKEHPEGLTIAEQKATFISESEKKGVHVLCTCDVKKIELMHASVMAHPKSTLLDEGKAETSMFWRDPDSGLLFKIRPDWICETLDMHFIVDVKTTADADFGKSVENYRYHVQDAFYSWVYENVTGVAPVFVFCTVSTTINCGRYPTHFSILNWHDKDVGAFEFHRNIESILICEQTGNYGGFEEISRPIWARKNDVVTS